MNATANHVPLAVVGCDFRVASSHWRSQLVLGEAQARQIARRLRRNQAADGFFDLNTCNRNEWIVSSHDPRWAAELLRTQMMQRAGPSAGGWLRPYVLTGEQAARHVFRVAIGQESLVVGERQIASQLYRALEIARARGTSSRILNGLGMVAARLVRIALRRGCIQNAAVGVHSLALAYLRHRIPRGPARVGVIGIGRIGRRVQGLLEEDERFSPVLCNRTVPADQRDRVRPLSALREVLGEVDAAVIATGALAPVVRPEHIQPRAGEHPLLLLDIGIPEQVERDGLPAGVEVAGLDDLTDYYRCKVAPGPREDDRKQAASLVLRAVHEFQAFCNQEAFCDILDTVQRHHRQLVGEEIPSLIARRLGYLPEETRGRVEADLKSIVLEYTNEIFRTIKEASGGEPPDAEATCRDEP